MVHAHRPDPAPGLDPERLDDLPSFVVVSPDTDEGKTTLSVLLLRAGARLDPAALRYWKPLQSGTPDTETVRAALGPDLSARVPMHPPARSFALPAAPTAAARHAGEPEPTIEELSDAAPSDLRDGGWLVETFGGPLSPLATGVSQMAWLEALDLPLVLVARNRVGVITQTLATQEALEARGLEIVAIALLGEDVAGNRAEVERASGRPTHCVPWSTPSPDAVAAGAAGDAERAEAAERAAAAVLAQLARASDRRARGRSAADALREVDARTVWHPYTPLVHEHERVVCTRTHGEWLELAPSTGHPHGERLVDAISSWWTCVHGHANPRLRRALARAARDHDQVIFADLAHEPGVRFAEELLDALAASTRDRVLDGSPLARVFYSDSGSTANEVALKVVLGGWRRLGAKPRTRDRFVCFENAYHGDTFATMAIGRDPVFFGEFEDLLFDVVQVPFSPEAVTAAIAEHGERLAGVILEPLIQAAGGMRMHEPATVLAACDAARSAGLPVVFDEVMTGFGRTGTAFAFEQLVAKDQDGGRERAFVPDVVTLGKGLSGGVLPLAATVVSQTWCEPWLTADRARMLFHGHSFTANPLACATGREGLAMFREGTPLEGAARIAERFAELVERAPSWSDRVVDPRACGAVFAFDLAAEDGDGPRGYLSARRERVIAAARAEGVFLRPLGDVVYAMPPLVTGDAALDRIERALARVAREA
jgi:adenosylmethionine-8-amino-7-oxononanoate aminotransferase